MKPGTTYFLCIVLGLLGGAFAEPPPLTEVAYHEGFEGVPPEVTLWASNGDCTVNAMGVTEERAYEGRRSFKLDVTLGSGSYHYWGAAVRIPAEGRLLLSARVLVSPESTVQRVGFGTNMIYPPSTHSGCGPVTSFREPTGDWQLVEADLAARATVGKDAVMRRHTVNLTGADVGAVLDRWSLFLYGRPGDRAVVYLDAVELRGQVPDPRTYEAGLRARYEQRRAAFQEQVAAWRRQLDAAAETRVALADVPPFFATEAQEILQRVARAEEIIAAASRSGHASAGDLDRVNSAFASLAQAPHWRATLARAISSGDPLLALGVARAIANRPPAVGLPLDQAPCMELSAAACPGENESLLLSVYALTDLVDLHLEISDLVAESGRIPAAALDPYLLTAWYQGAGGIGATSERVLKSELLLKDPELLRIAHEEKHNYLRSTAADGTESYHLCSGAESDNLAGVRPLDAAVLQPVSLPARGIQEFWITVRVPPAAVPGLYRGRVVLAAGHARVAVPVTLTVHDIELLPSRLTYSLYYRGRLSADGAPSITSERKSLEQYRAEILDMRDHGVLYPTNYQGWEPERLRQILEIRREAGLPTDAFFNLGLNTGNTTDPEKLAALQDRVRAWRALCAEYGYDTVYVYGLDEAREERLASQRQTWRAVQEAGGRTFVACYAQTFESMGSLLNCAVLANAPDPREAAKWHSVGSLAFCYANPQVGVEDPETYRRNFGLLLWKAGFDGAMNYAYQHGFGHVWNDFDSPRYRDHTFTYPTVNGIVGTIQWEGFREAVDDVRYVTTLEQAIAVAPPAKAEQAAAARDWLQELEPRTADLDATRQRMVAWIKALR